MPSPIPSRFSLWGLQVRVVGAVRLLQTRAEQRQAPLRHCDPTPQRDRLPTPGPRPHQLHPGHCGALEAHEWLQRAVAARDRPCRYRHPDCGREGPG